MNGPTLYGFPIKESAKLGAGLDAPRFGATLVNFKTGPCTVCGLPGGPLVALYRDGLKIGETCERCAAKITGQPVRRQIVRSASSAPGEPFNLRDVRGSTDPE